MKRIGLRFPKWACLAFSIGFLVSLTTGILWFCLGRWGDIEGEFGPEKHPWLGVLAKLHGAGAFFALIAFGMIWAAHVPVGWRTQRTANRAFSPLLVAGFSSSPLMVSTTADQMIGDQGSFGFISQQDSFCQSPSSSMFVSASGRGADKLSYSLPATENLLRFFRTDLAHKNVPPANLAAVCLQHDRAFGWQRLCAIPVIFHDRSIDHELVIEPDPSFCADLTDAGCSTRRRLCPPPPLGHVPVCLVCC